MNGTVNTSTATGNGGHFDPQQAAALLDQTTRRTRRALTPAQPWLVWASPNITATINTAVIFPGSLPICRGNSALIPASMPARHNSSRRPAKTKLTTVTISKK